jgi:hypothetical protein
MALTRCPCAAGEDAERGNAHFLMSTFPCTLGVAEILVARLPEAKYAF